MWKRLSILLIFPFWSCQPNAQNTTLKLTTAVVNYSIETVVPSLNNPWGMDWLPDGSLLITEKNGTLLKYKDGVRQEITHELPIYVRGQGGLLDVVVHPEFEKNNWIFLSFSSNLEGGSGGNTQLVRATLQGRTLSEIKTLYKATPNTTRGQHFGSRIALDGKGHVYFSVGDRGNRDNNPQALNRDGGKIYRVHEDGSIPSTNPFYGQDNTKQAIYSYGHRNPQGLVFHPDTGVLWSHEHGPKGGDEVNIINAGKNYGWPEITYGVNYSGTTITTRTTHPEMEQPIFYWTPSIAPCGMTFITGNIYPEWRNNIAVGSLKFNYVELLELKENRVVARKKIAEDIGRVRNVKMSPDGFLHIALEGQGIVKLVPKS